MVLDGNKVITIEDIKKYSLEILSLLEEENISSVIRLQKRLGESFKTSEGNIKLEARHSGKGIVPTDIALTLGYTGHGIGILTEIRLNIKSNYSFIIIKSSHNYTTRGYLQDVYGSLGNVIQSKRFELNFEKVKNELKKLCEQNDAKF